MGITPILYDGNQTPSRPLCQTVCVVSDDDDDDDDDDAFIIIIIQSDEIHQLLFLLVLLLRLLRACIKNLRVYHQARSRNPSLASTKKKSDSFECRDRVHQIM